MATGELLQDQNTNVQPSAEDAAILDDTIAIDTTPVSPASKNTEKNCPLAPLSLVNKVIEIRRQLRPEITKRL